MTNEAHADISWDTLQWTPIDSHIVGDVTGVRENGVVARETTAFVFLWRIEVDTERAFFLPTSAWVGRQLAFIHTSFAIDALIAVWACCTATEDLILSTIGETERKNEMVSEQ